jgi:hypothetical protein
MAPPVLLPTRIPIGPPHSCKHRAKPPPPRPGLMRRLLRAFRAAQQRKADCELAVWFIERHGGKFTDSVERQIERRLLGH